MAGGEVGLGLRRGALGADSVAHALVSALRLLSALVIATLVRALGGAAGTLAGADGKTTGVESRVRNERAALLPHETPHTINK